jgi:hypothetical protein
MISEDKTGLLKAFLGGLPGVVASRLAGAVEADRLLDGKALPHETILEGLRPILRDTHAARTPTPLRLFCRPFEDLLTSQPRKSKLKGSIARSSLLPIWLWLGRDVMPAQTQAYSDETRTLILARKYSEAARRAENFWAEAGIAMQAALAAPAASKVLNDPMMLADAQEIALLLPAGAALLRIQAVLARPVAQLNEDLIWQLRAIYDDLIRDMPDAAPYVAVVTMNRLAHPWEALRFPMHICRQHNDTLISKTDMGLVGEIIFGRMENLRDAILATRHPLFSAETLMAQMAQFTEMSSAIVKEIELKRDGEWGQRLLKDRAQTGAVMDVFMDRAMKEISAAIPVQKGTGGVPDFNRAANAEKREMALRYIRLVVGSRNFAAAGSFAAKQKTVYEEISAYLRRYIEEVVRELRGADPARRAVAESQFQLCVEMTSLLFSEMEAELLLRRGKAAQSAAASAPGSRALAAAHRPDFHMNAG